MVYIKKRLFLILLCLFMCGCQNQSQTKTETPQKASERPKETSGNTSILDNQAGIANSPDYEEDQKKIETYEEGNYKYHYRKDGDDIWITEIIPTSNHSIDVLSIPSEIDGKKVTKLGGKKDSIDGEEDCTSVFGIVNDGGEFSPKKRYTRVGKIKSIYIPDTVKTITFHCFQYLQDGKSIRIPQNLEENVQNLAISSIKWKDFVTAENHCAYKSENGLLLSSDGGMLYAAISLQKPLKKIVIPQTVNIISGSLLFENADEIHFPKDLLSIDGIGPSTKDPAKVTIEKGSKIYKVMKGSIVNTSSGRLVSAYVKDGVLDIPESVTNIDSIGYLGTKPSKIIVPSSMKDAGQILDMTESDKLTIVIKAANPPKVDTCCYGTAKQVKLYVPKGSKKMYEKKWASQWRENGDLTVKVIEMEGDNNDIS